MTSIRKKRTKRKQYPLRRNPVLRWMFEAFRGIMSFMVITYFGDRCYRLQSGETSCVVDPLSGRFKADVTLRTKAKAEPAALPENEFAFPGEYEAKGMEIQGIPIAEGAGGELKTVFVVGWEGITFAFLGHLGRAPDPELIEKIGEPDVVLMPLDAEQGLSPEHAAKIAQQLEPRVVVASPKNSKELERAFGQKAEPQAKFVFKKKDLADVKSRLVFLEKSAS